MTADERYRVALFFCERLKWKFELNTTMPAPYLVADRAGRAVGLVRFSVALRELWRFSSASCHDMSPKGEPLLPGVE